MKTKVILKEDMPALGHVGEVVEVAPGFARNYLLPRGLAWSHTADNLKRIEKARLEGEKRRAELRQAHEALAARVASLQLTFEEKAAESGHLYGSVNGARIAEALAAEGVPVNERDVRLPEPLKRVGEYEIPIHLHADLEVSVKVWVVAAQEAQT